MKISTAAREYLIEIEVGSAYRFVKLNAFAFIPCRYSLYHSAVFSFPLVYSAAVFYRDGILVDEYLKSIDRAVAQHI